MTPEVWLTITSILSVKLFGVIMRIFPFVSVKETPQLCSAKKSFTVEVIALGGSVGETVKLRDREELLSVNLTFFE